jgi:hypothetical protein
MAQNAQRNPGEAPRQTAAMTMKLPSVWGSLLILMPVMAFGTSIPGLVALVAICAIWIWYEAGPRS